jgi:hypothetical protein
MQVSGIFLSNIVIFKKGRYFSQPGLVRAIYGATMIVYCFSPVYPLSWVP